MCLYLLKDRVKRHDKATDNNRDKNEDNKVNDFHGDIDALHKPVHPDAGNADEVLVEAAEFRINLQIADNFRIREFVSGIVKRIAKVLARGNVLLDTFDPLPEIRVGLF